MIAAVTAVTIIMIVVIMIVVIVTVVTTIVITGMNQWVVLIATVAWIVIQAGPAVTEMIVLPGAREVAVLLHHGIAVMQAATRGAGLHHAAVAIQVIPLKKVQQAVPGKALQEKRKIPPGSW